MRCLCFFIVVLSRVVCLSQSDSSFVYHGEDSAKIKVIPVSSNSIYDDFSPVFLNNKLFFVSSRQAYTGVMYSNKMNTGGLTDIFCALKKDSVSFKRARSFSKQVNSKFSEGPFTFSVDGSRIFYTGNEPLKTGKDFMQAHLRLYSSENSGSKWQKPVPLPFCDPAFSYCHPALSQDGKTLFFCSDIPGGYGGMDIYRTTWEAGEWAKPVNIGQKVNGPSDELFPFISKNNVLYFSSKRAPGYGGLDLYTVDLTLADASSIEANLLEYPLNSSADDFGIWTDSTETYGYLSTNRSKDRGDEICYFNRYIPDFSKAPTPVFKNQFCYSFYEETALESNDTIGLAYEWNFGDGTGAKDLRARHCFKKPGDYTISLNAVDKTTGEVFSEQSTYTLTIARPVELIIHCPDTVLSSDQVTFNFEYSLPGYQLQQIFWYFSDGKYNLGARVKHTFKKQGIFEVQVGVVVKNTSSGKTEQFKTIKAITVKDNL